MRFSEIEVEGLCVFEQPSRTVGESLQTQDTDAMYERGCASAAACRGTDLPAEYAVLLLTQLQETKTIFSAYVGAVFASSGLGPAQEWVSVLLSAASLESLREEDPPTKKPKSEALSPKLPSVVPPAARPAGTVPVPRQSPPHLVPNPLAPAQPDLPFLPMFNQAAVQRRVQIEYPADLSGPPQNPVWTVRCVGACGWAI